MPNDLNKEPKKLQHGFIMYHSKTLVEFHCEQHEGENTCRAAFVGTRNLIRAGEP